jgi:adenosylmethionine-8-amino-7-oxononanoate aminotransferase
VLYHYTSQAGLLGIINSKVLWASNIFYLNDTTEFAYFVDLADDSLIQGCVDGLSGDHLLLAPPAIITEEQIVWAVQQLRAAVEETGCSLLTFL